MHECCWRQEWPQARRLCRVTLHVKEDAEDLLSEAELSRLIKMYSEFISFPIYLWNTNQKTRQVDDPDATAAAQAEADKKAEEEGKARSAVVACVASSVQLLCACTAQVAELLCCSAFAVACCTHWYLCLTSQCVAVPLGEACMGNTNIASPCTAIGKAAI